MALIAATPIPVDGFAVPATLPNAASAGGDEAESGPGRFLVVRNANAGAATVTVNEPAAVDGVVQYEVVVAATSGIAFIPLGRRNFAPHAVELGNLRRNTNVDDRAHWTYDITSSVTVDVYELPS